MFFLSDMLNKKLQMPKAGEALPGRDRPIPTAASHFISKRPLKGPYPEGLETAMFGLGCFWGAERLFWQTEGVWVTAVGYSGGITPNPTYQETCTGMTGHAEMVLVVFDPKIVSYEELLRIFWESHDPTQGMRQGNDVGTTYRSAIYTFGEDQARAAAASRDAYQAALRAAGR
ncbi:MAG: peptide-methionine (S)-S-oxide reductase MsrA, partial [Rhizobiaceae bacterium]